MAGDIFSKERAAVTLQDGTSGTLATGSEAAAATANLDARTGGNVPEDFAAGFELLVGFSVAPAANVTIDLYLVPALDGTNFGEVDTVNHLLQADHYVDSFVVLKAQTTAQRLTCGLPSGIPLMPALYKAYVKNNSAQTMAAAWTLKAISARDQYT